MDSCGKQQGPITLDQIKDLSLPPSTLIWKKGMREWTPLHSLISANLNTATQPLAPKGNPDNQHKPLNNPAVLKRSGTSESSYNAHSGIPINDTCENRAEKSKPTTFNQNSSTHHNNYNKNSASYRDKKLEIINMILIFVIFLPCTLLFQYLTMLSTSYGMEYYPWHGSKGLFNIVIFITKHWPLITIGIAGFYALASYFDWDLPTSQKQNLYISFTLAIVTLILGIIMISNPGLSIGIVLIAATIGVIILYLSSTKN